MVSIVQLLFYDVRTAWQDEERISAENDRKKADLPLRKVRYSRNYLILLTLVFSRLLRCSGLLRLYRRGRLLRLCRSLISHVGVLGLLLRRLLVLSLNLSRMSSLVGIILLLHLVVRVTILRDTEVPILTERQNHVEDGVQEEQANGEANPLPKRDTLLVQLLGVPLR